MRIKVIHEAEQLKIVQYIGCIPPQSEDLGLMPLEKERERERLVAYACRKYKQIPISFSGWRFKLDGRRWDC